MSVQVQNDAEASPSIAVYDAVIIGAGFAGLYMMHKLRDEQGLSVLGYEAASDVGGTWYWNRYPGARTDSLHSIYRFTSADVGEWSYQERYPAQAEVLEYLEFVADRLDLRRDFRFDTRVEAAHYDEQSNRWMVSTSSSEVVAATYLVTAVGLLSAPAFPSIEGLGSFRGDQYHTGTWPQDGVDLAGKRVGLIGTGSTGIQLLPHLADSAESVTVFQRTPNYVVPAQNRSLTEQEKREAQDSLAEMAKRIRQHPFAMPFSSTGKNALSVDDEYRRSVYQKAWDDGGFHFLFGTFDDIQLVEAANETVCEFIREKIRDIVDDPDVAELLSPKGYPYGAKRPPAGTNYYETFNRKNVALVDVRSDPIEKITPAGLRTGTRDFELDVIVFATGYDASTGSLARIDIRGRGGVSLAEKWKEGPVTNLGFSSAGFPNLLMVTGPLSPFANIPTCIEETVDWIADCVSYLREGHKKSIEASPAGEQAWTQHVNEVGQMLLASKGEVVNTWFMGANIEGKPHTFNVYFGGADAYFNAIHQAADCGYEGFVIE